MMLDRIVKWLDTLERVLTACTAMILALLSLLIGWQVLARYLLHSGQFWADELTLVGIMWGTMLGAAACVWTDSHVSLTFLVSRLPPTLKVWVLTGLDLILLAFALTIVGEGLRLVQRTMGGTMSALNIPIGVTYYVLPLSGGLIALFVLARSAKRITDHYRAGESEA
jgi:TRAP-type C4-dicarboxylate transport system permease small subunit